MFSHWPARIKRSHCLINIALMQYIRSSLAEPALVLGMRYPFFLFYWFRHKAKNATKKRIYAKYFNESRPEFL